MKWLSWHWYANTNWLLQSIPGIFVNGKTSVMYLALQNGQNDLKQRKIAEN